MLTVIVLGASGLLGASLVPVLNKLGHRVVAQSRRAGFDLCLDPCNASALLDALKKIDPDVIVNLVAATDVDQCETSPQVAWRINADVVGNLAKSVAELSHSSKRKPHVIQISTDQVYDGQGPHREDRVNLVNVYGISKYMGELFAERVDATILRTNFYGRSHCADRVSFSDWLVRRLREQVPTTVFDDVKFSAMHIDSLCDVIARCIIHRPVGIFNAGCRDSISKAQFALELAGAINLSTKHVTVGSSTGSGLKACRSLDMSLDVSKLEIALGIQCPSISGEIARTAKDYIDDKI